MDSPLWMRRMASANIMLTSTVLIFGHCSFCTSWGTVLVTTTWGAKKHKEISAYRTLEERMFAKKWKDMFSTNYILHVSFCTNKYRHDRNGSKEIWDSLKQLLGLFYVLSELEHIRLDRKVKMLAERAKWSWAMLDQYLFKIKNRGCK